MSSFYSSLMSSVIERGDVTLVRAPNSFPVSTYNRVTGSWDDIWGEKAIDMEEEHWDNQYEEDYNIWHQLWGKRHVIFFGDFDGIGQITSASSKMSVHAFLHGSGMGHYYGVNGERFSRTKEMKTTASYHTAILNHWKQNGFQGKAFVCSDASDFINATKGVK